MNFQSGGTLIYNAFSHLHPEVFSHPVWTYFGDDDSPISHELVEDLLKAAHRLQIEGDHEGACQTLLLCAVRFCYSGAYGLALSTTERALRLAKSHGLIHAMEWAYWGASAVCVQQGDIHKAVRYLNHLQSTLYKQSEWVLAIYVEMIQQTLPTKIPPNGSTLATVLNSSSIEPMLRIAIDWLQNWGKPYPSSPETPRVSNGNPPTDRQSPLDNFLPILSIQGWRSICRNIIGKGEQRLKWFKKKAPLPDSQKILHGKASPTHRSSTNFLDPSISSYPSSLMDQATDKTKLKPSLIIYCLGSFRVYQNGKLIEKWPGNKCKQILKYLMIHRNRSIHHEILIEKFWPEIDPEAALRNLYQAIYSLRQVFQNNDPNFPYIITEEGTYGLNPELEIWMDSDSFNQHYQDGRNLARESRIEEAVREFKSCENLYGGEFLADDRYEDWPLFHRENIKHAYLDILDFLSQYYFDRKQYDMCTIYCQKVLVEDNCREDAHRLLMRCYLEQDHPHLALRQYHLCVETLKRELDVSPMPATEDLYRQIHMDRFQFPGG